MTVIRWGIVSAGKISHDFCVGLSTLSPEEHKVVAVAARDKQRASEFAEKHKIPKSFGNYLELAQCQDIDVIYIGALNPQHFEIAKLMLDHGRHVLCEKPLCMNSKQTTELVAYAKEKKRFLMEAVWSRFFPAYQYLRQQIDTGKLGTIKEVEIAFGFPLQGVERLQKNDLGGGVVLDLGIYTIQCSQWAFCEQPRRISAKGELNAERVDIDVNAELQYANGGVARMHFSALRKLENKAIIKGTKGEITIHDFHCPTKLIDIDGTEKEWPLPKGSYATNFSNSEGLRYEAVAVRESIIAGKLENINVSHEDSRLFAEIQDEIRKQIGVVYPEDQN